MKRVFIAFAFRDEDQELANYVDQLLASYDIRSTTGENLGGDQLTPAVQTRIEDSDGLIALLTRRDQKVSGSWTTHPWVRDELAYARNKGKQAIALIEDGVDVDGMYAPHEYIPLSRDNPLKAFLALAQTFGEWKRRAGRTLKVQILPMGLARKVASINGSYKCRHRFLLEGSSSEWIEVEPIKETGGTFVYLKGVRDDHMIQLHVEDQGTRWTSPATSQWMQIQLSREDTAN